VKVFLSLRLWVVLVLAAVVVGVGAFVVGWNVGGGSEPVPAPSVRVEEDEPGWDCRTMGNRVCGEGVER